MAGPLDLRGRVTITNGASGTLGAIRRDLASIGQQTGRMAVAGNALATGARNVNRFAAGIGAATVGTWGLVAAVNKAEAFNRNVFGVGVAAMGEHTRKVVDAASGLEQVVVDYDKVAEAMQRVDDVSTRLSRSIGQAPSRISGIAEVLAKAGFDTDKLEAATRATAIISATDMETPVQRIGEFASVLDTIYKRRDGEAWGAFFARQLDIVRIAAAETRLSVGSMMEGLRPFSALYAQLGNLEADNALLLMAGVKKGGEATEIGHTLKSNAVRFMRMTPEAQSRMAALGLRRGDYTDLSTIDPSRATGTLARLFPEAGIKGNFRQKIAAAFAKAIESGDYLSDDFHEKISRRIAKAGRVNMRDELSRERFMEKYNNAVFGSGMRVDMLKLYRDLIGKGATPADVSTIFEGRRIGYNMQILEGLREFGMGPQSEYVKKLSLGTGAGIDATQKVFDMSRFGALQRFETMWENFQIKLANSEGFQSFLTGLTKVFDVLGQMPSWMTTAATAAGVLAVAITPLAFLFRTVAGAARLVRYALGLVGLGGAGAAAGGGMASLLGAGAAGAAGSTLLGRRLAAGMSAAGAAAANKAVGDTMIKGMSGAATVAGGAALGRSGLWAGAKMLGRGALRFIPGLGLVLMAGGAAYGAYNAYSQGGGAGDIAKGAALGSLGIDGLSAQAAEAQPGDSATAQAADALGAAQQAAAEIERTFADVDLSAAGRRMMETLAAGITAGGASAVAAANSVAAQVRAAGERVQLNTGPAMSPAR